MPYIAGTPEAIQARLGRKDSRNFATTCRGINPSTGSQCRRGLSKSANGPSSGIITFINGEEAFFCWQHKDQAKDMVLKHTASWQMRRNQQGRTSLDTLIETIEVKVGSNTGKRSNGKTPVVTATATATAASGKKETVGVAAVGPEAAKLNPNSLLEEPSEPSPYSPFPKPKEHSFFYKLLLCCFGYEPSGKERNPDDATSSALAVIPEGTSEDAEKKKGARRPHPANPQVGLNTTPMSPEKLQPKSSAIPSGSPNAKKTVDKSKKSPREAAQNQSLFSVIPKHLSPETARAIQQELLKPFSDKDEPGYIYIFWLQDKPTVDAAGQPKTATAPTNVTVAGDATGPKSKGNSNRVLFKIGRAANVQRRLHQWTEQCNYNLSLVRYYPHISITTPQKPLQQQSTNTISVEPRKVPNVHKIERLIHLELRDDPLVNPPELNNPCKVCGRRHKEWFSIEATREGITTVDETIKRWIKWGEDNVDLYKGQSFDPKTGAKLSPLAASPRANGAANGVAGSSPKSKKKDGPTAAGVVGPKQKSVNKNVQKPRKRQDDEDSEYRTESDEEEEWVEIARVDTGGKGKKKVQVYRD